MWKELRAFRVATFHCGAPLEIRHLQTMFETEEEMTQPNCSAAHYHFGCPCHEAAWEEKLRAKDAECARFREALADSKWRERKWHKAAKQWMASHDKLKNKYEPMVVQLCSSPPPASREAEYREAYENLADIAETFREEMLCYSTGCSTLIEEKFKMYDEALLNAIAAARKALATTEAPERGSVEWIKRGGDPVDYYAKSAFPTIESQLAECQAALVGLMEAYRIIYSRSVSAAQFANDQLFVDAWKRASDCVGKTT